jgi:hypothetical protein
MSIPLSLRCTWLLVPMLAFQLVSCGTGLRPDEVQRSAFLDQPTTDAPRWTVDCGKTNPTHSWTMGDDELCYFRHQDRTLLFLDPTTGKTSRTITIPAELMPEPRSWFANRFVKRMFYYRAHTGPIVRISPEGDLQTFAVWADQKKAIEDDGGMLTSPSEQPVRDYSPALQRTLSDISERAGHITHRESVGDHLLVTHYVYSHRLIAGGLAMQSNRKHDTITLLDGHSGERIWSQNHKFIGWVGLTGGLAIIAARGSRPDLTLAGIDPMTGTPRWAIWAPSMGMSHISLAGEQLTLIDRTGSVALIDTRNGAVTRRAHAGFYRKDDNWLVHDFEKPPYLRHRDSILVCSSHPVRGGSIYTLRCLDLRAVSPEEAEHPTP